jgi:hypothetical protein
MCQEISMICSQTNFNLKEIILNHAKIPLSGIAIIFMTFAQEESNAHQEAALPTQPDVHQLTIKTDGTNKFTKWQPGATNMDFILDQDEMEFMNLSRVSASSMPTQEKPLELLSLKDV